MLEKLLLIKEVIELIHHYRKLILTLIIIGLAFLFLLLVLGSNYSHEKELESLRIWNGIEKGDSVYVKKNVYYLDFYKKGRQELSDYEQKEINYRRTDSLNFIKQNSIHEKYFYQNRTSFIGICIGKDSSVTKEGKYNNHRWLAIKPSYKISNPPKSDKYDFDARKWENNSTDYFVVGNLSKIFYLKFDDITIVCNDSIFNQ